MSNIQSIINNLSGPDFSYQNYLEEAKMEWESDSPPTQPAYVYQTADKVKRIFSSLLATILSIMFFPYAMYRLVHYFGGKLMVPSQLDTKHSGLRKHLVRALQGEATESSRYDYFTDTCSIQKTFTAIADAFPNQHGDKLIAKRISVDVNGRRVDATILGRRKYLQNRRWTLISNGNSATMEDMMADFSPKLVRLIDEIGTNFLLYNYEGIGASSGYTTRDRMIRDHRAMINFLEDEKNGIGAKQIIQIGVSIGGGVQGHAMKFHPLIPGIRYVFVKHQTFSRVSQVPSRLKGWIIKLFGWELSSYTSSIQLEKYSQPEIIIQSAKQPNELTAEMITDDTIIPVRATHAYHLLSQRKDWQHKKFIGVDVAHCRPLKEPEEKAYLEALKDALKAEYQGFF